MTSLTILYIISATLLLLHEIEAAYEKEWEILKLPGKLTGFLLMHAPIILLLFYGVLEVDRGTAAGIGGLLPFAVHKIKYPKVVVSERSY